MLESYVFLLYLCQLLLSYTDALSSHCWGPVHNKSCGEACVHTGSLRRILSFKSNIVNHDKMIFLCGSQSPRSVLVTTAAGYIQGTKIDRVEGSWILPINFPFM